MMHLFTKCLNPTRFQNQRCSPPAESRPNPSFAVAAAPEAAMLPELPDDIVADILLRLPPDDPACLLRASLACKLWRRILADPAFRRRHGELHPAPSVLGFLQVVGGVGPVFPHCSRFVPGNPNSGRPAARDLPGWLAIDCRHGRALFVTPASGLDIEDEEGVTLEFVVWDPLALTDERHHLPPPSPPPNPRKHAFNAAVLCAAASGGCDHRGCHRGPFRVAYVFSTFVNTRIVTFASEYSSETGIWSTLTHIQPPNVHIANCPCASALVGDTLYFRGENGHAFGYQLGVQRLSVIEPPQLPVPVHTCCVDGKLGFFSVEKNLSLCLWLQETALSGVAQWAQAKVIKMDALLPREVLLPPKSSHPRWISVTGSVEGTDAILMGVPNHGFDADIYMVELNSGRSKKVFDGFSHVFPYTSFCIPVIGSGSTDDGPEKDV